MLEVSLQHIHAARVSVREQAAIVVDRLRRSGTMTFRALCGDSPDTLTTVARFLSLLELFREGAVAFDQVTPLGELTVRWTGGERGRDRDHRRVRRRPAGGRRGRPAPGRTRHETRPRRSRDVEETLDVPLAALRPALEAVLMIADQPLDALTLASAVGHPVDDVGAALGALAAEYDRAGPGLRAAQRGRRLAVTTPARSTPPSSRASCSTASRPG